MTLDGDRPRERLLRLGSTSLSDAELLALLLRTGSRGRTALEVAQRVLAERGGLAGLARSAVEELVRVPGLGPARAAGVLAAVELGRRLAGRRLPERLAVRDPGDVFRHFHPRLRDADQECFVALLLDGRHRLLREEWISRGTLTASLVHPREVFRPALRACAAALVLVHNHPSGDPTPSPEDRQVTRRLARAGELLGIQVVDHVVVAERGYASLREEGSLSGPTDRAG
ncbi:MAG: RadC family protein [Myxococcota bacterium]